MEINKIKMGKKNRGCPIPKPGRFYVIFFFIGAKLMSERDRNTFLILRGETENAIRSDCFLQLNSSILRNWKITKTLISGFVCTFVCDRICKLIKLVQTPKVDLCGGFTISWIGGLEFWVTVWF